MIALLTGDTGFIGTNMKQFLIKRNVEVIGFSRKKGLDVLNLAQLKKVIKNVDLVFHFAAEAKPAESVLEPLEVIETNLKGSLNVLEACKECNVPLIYPSSCEIYGDDVTPMKEDHPLNPTNPYAASKAAIDRICFMYCRAYNLDVKIIRLFNPYGPHQQLNKIMPTFYFQSIIGEPITVYGDGTDTRDYTYIEDLVEGFWLSKDLPAGEAINLATGKSTTNLEVAKLIKEITGSNSPIIFANYPKLFGGIRNQVGSYEKAEKLIGWKPKFSFREGLTKTIEWLKTVREKEK
jgi:nucleoside-diphosphate-sugar epimerase